MKGLDPQRSEMMRQALVALLVAVLLVGAVAVPVAAHGPAHGEGAEHGSDAGTDACGTADRGPGTAGPPGFVGGLVPDALSDLVASLPVPGFVKAAFGAPAC